MAAHFFLFLFVGVACALGLVIFSTMKSLIDGIGRGLSSLMHIFLDMARATAIIATASGVGALVGVAVGFATSRYPNLDGVASGLVAGLIAFLFAIPIVEFLSRSEQRTPHFAHLTGAESNVRAAAPAVATTSLEATSGIDATGPDRAPKRVGFWSRWFIRPATVPEKIAGDRRLESAWHTAQTQADWASSRIAVAKTSCLRLAAQADQNPADIAASDWVNVVRKRVPALVDECLALCASATASERRNLLEELVQSLEDLAAEAEIRRDSSRRAARGEFDILRNYIAERTRHDRTWL